MYLIMKRAEKPSFKIAAFLYRGSTESSPSGVASPHFSQGFYCGVTEHHVYCVALLQAPRHTVKYACGAFSRAPCIHGPLHRLATKPCEKCGLVVDFG
jgi:hypothetical protein